MEIEKYTHSHLTPRMAEAIIKTRTGVGRHSPEMDSETRIQVLRDAAVAKP